MPNILLSQNNTATRPGLRLFRYSVGSLLILFLVFRFFVKDWIDAFSILYYSTPLPILTLFSLMLGLFYLFRRRIRFAGFCFIFMIGSIIAWSCESFSTNSNIPTPDNMKLFFWNAAKNKKADEITKYIDSFDSDLIGIVEARIRKKQIDTWKNVFSNYEVELLRGEMALITRGKILSKKSGSLSGRGRFNLLEVALNGELFHVLLVDIDADPLRSRAPALKQLSMIIRSYSQTNLIVMGDFNIPHDSVLFKSFHQSLTHAFESGGTGFAKTWPLPIPVLALDHIWVSKKMKVVRCNLGWSEYSDHRAVLAHISSGL